MKEQIKNRRTTGDNQSAVSIKRDMEASILFYESIGITVKQRWANHYAQLTAPGITIGLHPVSDNGHANGSGNISAGFTTDNFEESKAYLQKLNINITARSEEGGIYTLYRS